jgi:hypothetical protein
MNEHDRPRGARQLVDAGVAGPDRGAAPPSGLLSRLNCQRATRPLGSLKTGSNGPGRVISLGPLKMTPGLIRFSQFPAILSK